jgi:hypothetical protein
MLRMQSAFIGQHAVELSTFTLPGVAHTPGVVTLQVLVDDDTAVSHTPPLIDGNGTGKHTSTITVARPTHLTLTWTVDGTVFPDDTLIVYRRPLLTVDELREAEPSLAPLTNDGTQLARAIAQAVAHCERVTRRSWTRQYARQTVLVADDDLVVDVGLHNITRIGKCHRITRYVSTPATASTTVTTTVMTPAVYTTTTTPAEAVIIPGTSMLRFPCGGEYNIGFEYGEDEPPVDIREAVAMHSRLIFHKQRGGVLTSFTSTIGNNDTDQVTRMMPSFSGSGSPEVDATYERYALLRSLS